MSRPSAVAARSGLSLIPTLARPTMPFFLCLSYYVRLVPECLGHNHGHKGGAVASPPRAWWQVAKRRQVSGFTRDPYWYGGLLVYEPLDCKWRRHHARCRGDISGSNG
jgi:hypothetical protein